MGLKENIAQMKISLNNRKAIENEITYKVFCSVYKGTNHIFTKKFVISRTENGDVYINSIHKVKIMSCEDYNESYITKSATKKILGAATGGLLTGGFGAIVGALAVGNNKKINNKFNKLVAIDEFGGIYEIILKNVFLQKYLIEACIHKGESI